MITVVLETTRCLIAAVIIILTILCLVRSRPEGYRREAFPRGEARYYDSSENQYGIPRCRYGSYTPILECTDK
jgi:hypothetical protein